MITLAIRATVLLVAAVGVSWALGRRSAGSRHALWTATFVLLLVLPAASVWLPAWEVGVPGFKAPESTMTSMTSPASGEAGWAGINPASGAAAPTTRVSGQNQTTVSGPAEHPLAEQPLAGPPLAVHSLARHALARPSGERQSSFRAVSILTTVWGLGILGALLSIGVGQFRFRRLVRSARPATGETWLADLATVGRNTRVTRRVALVVTPRASAPMTGGIRKPVIVLPAESVRWTAEQRRLVLTHELIHVRRHDALRQVLGKTALALYWFHPLSWLAARQSGVVRELACDEEVLSLGTRPSEYASLLLDLARGVDDRSPAVLSLAMIQPSQLERRLMSILDPTRPERSALATGAALLAIGAFGISAAIAQPVPTAQQVSANETPPEPLAAIPLSPELAELTALVEARTTPLETSEAFTEPTAFEPLLPIAIEPQDPSCRMEGQSGNFSGTWYSSDSRTEVSGRHNGDRVIQKYIDDLRLCMRIRGDVTMSDDNDAVRSIGGGNSWVVLESEGDDLHRLIITGGSGDLEYAWSVDGRDQPFGSEAQEWRDRMLTVLGGYWEAASLRGQQASLRGQIASYRGEVASMRGQIASHRGQVASLNGQIASERGQIASLRGTVAGLRGQIRALEANRRVTSSEQTLQRLEEEIAQVRQQIAEVEEQIAVGSANTRISALEAQIDEYDIDERIREVESELEDFDLDSRVMAVEREIEALDADRRAEAIESRLESEVAALRRLLARL